MTEREAPSGWLEFQTYYQGRKWDAPITDDSVERDISSLGLDCIMCGERIAAEDDAIMSTQAFHLECQIRSGMGDVQHLERRCLCYKGAGGEVTLDSDHYTSYREEARAALQWLIDHHQGRFHHDRSSH